MTRQPPSGAGSPAGHLRLLSTTVVLFALVAIALTLAVVVAGGSRGPVTRAEVAHQIASGVRCPVCRDLSAADSPAPMAAQMRQQIGQQLTAGRSPDQIRAGFVAAYGESVLMSPPNTGLGRTAYLLPVLLMGGGLAAVVLLLRRWRRDPGPGLAGLAEKQQLDPVLSSSDRRLVDRALIRLREEEGR